MKLEQARQVQPGSALRTASFTGFEHPSGPFLLGSAMGVIRLYRENPQTYEREALGTITEKQLDSLIDNFEEEFEEDEEYLLNAGTLDFLKDQNVDKSLITLLEKALAGTRDGIDILYLVE